MVQNERWYGQFQEMPPAIIKPQQKRTCFYGVHSVQSDWMRSRLTFSSRLITLTTISFAFAKHACLCRSCMSTAEGMETDQLFFTDFFFFSFLHSQIYELILTLLPQYLPISVSVSWRPSNISTLSQLIQIKKQK